MASAPSNTWGEVELAVEPWFRIAQPWLAMRQGYEPAMAESMGAVLVEPHEARRADVRYGRWLLEASKSNKGQCWNNGSRVFETWQLARNEILYMQVHWEPKTCLARRIFFYDVENAAVLYRVGERAYRMLYDTLDKMKTDPVNETPGVTLREFGVLLPDSALCKAMVYGPPFTDGITAMVRLDSGYRGSLMHLGGHDLSPTRLKTFQDGEWASPPPG